MCGIVGYLDKRVRHGVPSGRLMYMMLEALGCRGPDSAGVALLHDLPELMPGDDAWTVRIAAGVGSEPAADLTALEGLGRIEAPERQADSLRFRFHPALGVMAADVETALRSPAGADSRSSAWARGSTWSSRSARRPSSKAPAYGVSTWCGSAGDSATPACQTESRIDLSHSQPFLAGVSAVLDTLAQHGSQRPRHQLSPASSPTTKKGERAVTFYTDNDSEVIGVYLRDRLDRGRTLPQALGDSLADLDGAYNYLVAAPDGLGIVRDRFGFKPLVVAETDEFVAVATEEIALRRALPGAYRVAEPPIGVALLPYALPRPRLVSLSG